MEGNLAKGIKKGLRPALGRGLSALISAPAVPVLPTETPHNQSDEREHEVHDPSVTRVTFLKLDRIDANPTQPRQHFSEIEIKELSDSIKTLGVLQPILVRPGLQEGRYQIVAGERRFRAATLADLTEVPVIVKAFDDRETLEVALVENVQRQSLSPVEEARGYQRLIDEFSFTAQEVADKVGKDRATVANIVRVLRLPSYVQSMLSEGRISLGHAKAILTVREPAAQISLAKKVEDEHLSVRALEAIVARVVILDPPKKTAAVDAAGAVQRTQHISPHPELEERLRNNLGTKVSIHKTKGGAGSVELHFYSDDELDRLVEILSVTRE